jgi:hypothetical protein
LGDLALPRSSLAMAAPVIPANAIST